MTQERHHWRRSDVFIVKFDHISHLALVLLLLTFNIWLPTVLIKLYNSDHGLRNWNGHAYCRQQGKTNRPLRTATLLKKETLAKVFSWGFWEEFLEHLFCRRSTSCFYICCIFVWLDKRQSSHHIKTSQLICSADQLIGLYMIVTSAFSELN